MIIDYRGYSSVLEQQEDNTYHGKIVDENNIVTYYIAKDFQEAESIFK